jgi:hypothetical protein
MFALPTLPRDAFPLVAFTLGTAGIIAAKIWSWNLDRWERQDKSAQADLMAYHATAAKEVGRRPPIS